MILDSKITCVRCDSNHYPKDRVCQQLDEYICKNMDIKGGVGMNKCEKEEGCSYTIAYYEKTKSYEALSEVKCSSLAGSI